MESFIVLALEFFLIFPAAAIRYLLFNGNKAPFKTFLKQEDWFLNSSISLLVLTTIAGGIYSVIS